MRSERRIFAATYSKSTMSQFRAQGIVTTRVAKLLEYIRQQRRSGPFSGDLGIPIVVREAFRALQADIFTALVFSEKEGTNFLEDLRPGLKSESMDVMDFFHDDKREPFFFWESERPFKYFFRFIMPSGPAAQERAQRWLGEIISRYEMVNQAPADPEDYRQHLRSFDCGTYKKLLLWRNPDTGRPLDWNDRASEIMDHMGK